MSDDLKNKQIELTPDKDGSMYQSLESNNDLSISYEMIDGTKTVNNTEIHSDNVSLDEIASYTSYTKKTILDRNDFERIVA